MIGSPVTAGGGMGYDRYRVSIETLENGYKVEVPDLDEMEKKKAAAVKAKQPEPYMGDCVKSYAAKSPREVLKLVRAALEKLPGVEYDMAFDEAAAKTEH